MQAVQISQIKKVQGDEYSDLKVVSITQNKDWWSHHTYIRQPKVSAKHMHSSLTLPISQKHEPHN
uniref:Uncharacterized protein n=1 Tax=Oryza brachyantha TaxID=4533 RepID=J3N0G9_ORYBR